MKKITRFLLFTCLMVGFYCTSQAQSYNAKIGDSTITNAGSPSYILAVRGHKTEVTFEYVIAKTSGTIAGSIVLAGSIDGSHYVTLNTYTLTDATANAGVAFASNGYTNYKVTVSQTGTSVANYKIWALYR